MSLFFAGSVLTQSHTKLQGSVKPHTGGWAIGEIQLQGEIGVWIKTCHQTEISRLGRNMYRCTCLPAYMQLHTYPYYMCSFVNRNYQPSSSRSSKERPLDLQFIIVALAPKAHRDYDPRMSMLPSFPFPVLYRHTYVTHCSQSHLFVHYTYSTSLHTGGQAVVCICVVGASLGAVLLMPCRIPPPPPNPVHWAPWSYYINYISRSFIQSNARRKTKDTLRSAPA